MFYLDSAKTHLSLIRATPCVHMELELEKPRSKSSFSYGLREQIYRQPRFFGDYLKMITQTCAVA